MTAIIFGANGQDGFYLTKLFQDIDCKVIGISRSGNFNNIDITNFLAVSNLIKENHPDFVFHLAANSTTRHDALFENHATIATGTLNILESINEFSPKTKIFISGSGLQFKNSGMPIKETDPFEARDAYSISRIQSVYAARYFRSIGIKSYVGYFFNHDSPRRTERHIAKKIAEAAKRISKGSEEKIEIGDMDVVKEWTYAGDIVDGLWQFMLQDEVYEANISSGIGYSIKDWLKVCFDLIGKDYRNYVIQNTNFVSEYRQLVSNACLIQSLGFKPSVSFSNLAKMMVLE